MTVQAVPTEADIELLSSNGVLIEQSKGSLFYELKRKKGYFDGANYNIKVTAEGYESQVISITSSANGWYIGGNILVGGLIGWLIVDPATGGMWSLEANNGQDTESLKVILLKDASSEMLSSAKKISKN